MNGNNQEKIKGQGQKKQSAWAIVQRARRKAVIECAQTL